MKLPQGSGLAGVELGARPAHGIDRVHAAGQDAHPPEQAAAHVPDRALGQLTASRHGELGLQDDLPRGPEAERSA